MPFNPWDYIGIWDFLLLPVYLVVVYIIAKGIQNRKELQHPEYKYFTTGLMVKIIGGLAFSFVYLFYYQGGDTTEYFYNARVLNNMLFHKPDVYFSVTLLGNNSTENFFEFSHSTGFPGYIFSDNNAFAVSRLSSPLVMLGLNFFLPSVVIVNVISYLGFWKFYKMLAQIYKQNFDILKFAAFFIPSVVFWGSGIMKDTYTITAVLWFTYTVYMVFVKKQRQRTNICLLLLNAWIIIMLKPYIFLALLPSTFFWLSHKWTTGIKNKLMRSLVAPGLLAVGFLVSLGILSIIGNSLGRYSDADSIMKKAKATQQDLIRGEQYGENYFDIGEYDFTPASLVSKVPAAITAGIFRPFLWEAKNIVMLISGLENFIILLVFGIMIFRVGLIYLVGIVRSDPFLMFSFFFVIIIAFSVGLTTANFGALVRYRIPLMPFLVVLVLELWHQKKMKSEKELQLTSSKHLDQIS